MTTASKPALSLHAKLAAVMDEAERIPKNGKAPAAMGGYPFVQVGDAADFIRKALGSRGVSMLPTTVELIGQSEHETARGGTMTTAELRITWTLTDGETGESTTFQSYGVGADTGDKYSGKATTTAMKYALLSGFLLSTGDDVENVDTSDRGAPVAGANGESLELLGNLTKAGTVQKGGGPHYQGEWREQPDGHAIGFRLKLEGDDRDIPQVIVKGSIGELLYLHTSTDGGSLMGQKVTVKGKLFNVRQPARRTFYRLVIGEHPDSDFIETADVRIPAFPEQTDDTPPDTISAPMFDPVELDPEERLLIGGGKP